MEAWRQWSLGKETVFGQQNRNECALLRPAFSWKAISLIDIRAGRALSVTGIYQQMITLLSSIERRRARCEPPTFFLFALFCFSRSSAQATPEYAVTVHVTASRMVRHGDSVGL